MNRRILAAFLIVFTIISLFSFKIFGTEDVKTFERVDFISGVVNANELNLRNGPSLDSDIIGTFKRHKWVNCFWLKLGTGMRSLTLIPEKSVVLQNNIYKI